VTVAAADDLLGPITAIDGFRLAALIDASTGMILASAQQESTVSVPVAAAGAADIASVLDLLTSELAGGEELEDITVTFTHHFHFIRIVRPTPAQTMILLVILDRGRANLTAARRALRSFCASFAR
jgi:hypothetical protein